MASASTSVARRGTVAKRLTATAFLNLTASGPLGGPEDGQRGNGDGAARAGIRGGVRHAHLYLEITPHELLSPQQRAHRALVPNHL